MSDQGKTSQAVELLIRERLVLTQIIQSIDANPGGIVVQVGNVGFTPGLTVKAAIKAELNQRVADVDRLMKHTQ